MYISKIILDVLNMDYSKLILIIVFSLISNYIYSSYKNSEELFESKEHYQFVSEYFIGDKMSKNKPILWMFSTPDINARNWQSFYSRNTLKINQPYLQITMKSIYDKCKDSFNVCLINDDVFDSLLNWNINIHDVPQPNKDHYRHLGLSMIVYYYGGFVVPPSFLCIHDLYDLYSSNIKEKGVFVLEGVNHGVTSSQTTYMPNIKMMASKKNNTIMKKCVEYQEYLFLDKTAQPDFIDNVNLWCNRNIPIVDGKYIGIKKITGEAVTVDELLGTTPIEYPMSTLYGIYIPQEEVLSRGKYKWFARMSTDQIIQSQLMISQYMLASY
jgi:hypothetical protein